MDLESLEELLGVQLLSCGKVEIISADKWYLVNERLGREGETRLMLAASGGAVDCVELLLRCGADVDARDRIGRMAIDHSVIGNHPEATLSLLRFDSILPSAEGEEERYRRLQNMVSQHECLQQFFSERDGFHKMLIEGGPGDVENVLRQSEETRGTHRRWVNSEGQSALYTAADKWKYDLWALLRSSGFVYATTEERVDMEANEDDDSFHCAIGRYFVELDGCHVQKMVSKSRVYKTEGVDEMRCGERVDVYFRDIDGEEYSSDLLRCLQDDPSLEIVFDFSSMDIQCMHPTGNRGSVFGLTDFDTNRIYVAAMETEEFDYSDVVSNLVHELTHKALSVVFENRGLPFRSEDAEAEEEYDRIVHEMILSNNDEKGFDRILQRALDAGHLVNHELIVRVPEMIVKFKDRNVGHNKTENGFSRLRRQAPDLLDFYTKQVLPEVKDCIRSNRTANKAVKSELLRTVSLLTSFCSERINVIESIGKAEMSKHNQLTVLKVSNLKLGVSHVKSTLEEVTFVDWTKYICASNYFVTALSRNEIKSLALIWDKQERPPFCNYDRCRSDKCIARKMVKIVHASLLIVPKNLTVMKNEEESVHYLWKDLSLDTRQWILEKKLTFGGKLMHLKDIVSCVSGSNSVEDVLEEILSADDLSLLIDRENVEIGRSLNNILKERGFELLHSHPKCHIPRSLQLRHLDFNKEVFERRSSDVFIIRNAEKSRLERDGFPNSCVWDGNIPPVGFRCFILNANQSQKSEDDVFGEILRTLKEWQMQDANRVMYNYIHFFEFINDGYHHIYSLNSRLALGSSEIKATPLYSAFSLLTRECDPNEVLIIADVPGSGKSLLVNKTAVQVRKRCPKRLVDLVELPLFENIIKVWKENDFDSEGKVMDCLYALIKQGDSGFERKIMNLFCNTKSKSMIFFDGFDEICPDYRGTVTSFVEALIERTNVKVAITTRTHECADLEENLATIAYEMVPLDRSEQVKLINLEWNASLLSIPTEERETKIMSLISGLERHNDLKASKVTSELIQNLKLTMKENAYPITKAFQFDELAEELMRLGKSIGEGEGEFSETPLHTWMMAYVAFADNFHFRRFNYLSGLYKQFVDIKINLYCREKSKAPELVAADGMIAGFKSSAYQLLKKYSAFFFLEENVYNLKSDEIHILLRVGLVATRGKSVIFVHRTFGEYLLSLWLIEMVQVEKIAKIWLSSVLLENKYEKVRQFIDSLLLSSYDNTSADCEAVEDMDFLSRSPFPSSEEFIRSVQMCLYKSIVECNGGILQYLMDSSGDCLDGVIFGKTDWSINMICMRRNWMHSTRNFNAFTFCGGHIRSEVGMTSISNTLSEIEILTKLLRLTRDHDLTENLNQFILEEGLWWTGADMDTLLRKEEGKAKIRILFESLLTNKDVLGRTMKKKMFDPESDRLFVNSARYAFDMFTYILESITNGEDLENCLLEQKIFVSAWTRVIQFHQVHEVEQMWGYVKGKLATRENGRKFLVRRNGNNWNALFAAFWNADDPSVAPYVWGLFRQEFDEGECKEVLMDTFHGVKGIGSKPQNIRERLLYGLSGLNSRFNHCGLFKWLFDLLRDEYLDGEEVSRLLLSQNDGEEEYLLRFFDCHNLPQSLYRLQDLLFTTKLRSMHILGRLTYHEWLARECFSPSCWDADFVASIESEFESVLPHLDTFPLAERIRSDDDGCLVNVSYTNKERIHSIRLKSYVVLLRRQFELEQRTYGSRRFLMQLKGVWCYDRFPRFITRGGEAGSRAYIVPYFFAVLSKFLSEEQVGEVLLDKGLLLGSVFHQALRDVDERNGGDPRAFLAMYDVARWSLGVCALYRVHAVGGGGLDRRTVLQILLEDQEEGVFEYL